MATAYVTEFSGAGSPTSKRNIDTGSMQAPLLGASGAIANQSVTFTTSAATSNALNATTTLVKVEVSAGAFMAVGTAPTATTSDIRLGSTDTPYYFAVEAGSGVKLAFYDGSS